MIYRINKAEIRPLEGKYYGTIIDIFYDGNTASSISVWTGMDSEPSTRELAACKNCNSDYRVEGDCRECFDNHFETENDYNLSKIICSALNKEAEC